MFFARQRTWRDLASTKVERRNRHNASFTLKAKRQVRKAVIPAAGMGTRVRHLTQDQPKEMFPFAGRPMISYVLQEAALSGLEELYIIINESKDSLHRYLESGDVKQDFRENHGQNIPPPRLMFVNQPSPAGSGDAIYLARELIGDEPFALMMPDFVFFGDTPALKQLTPLYDQSGCDIVGLLQLQGKEAEGFGNVGVAQGKEREQGIVVINSLSSKVSTPLMLRKDERILKAVPRWILGPHFFEYLERGRVPHGEWDDTPALQMLCKEREVLGKILEGKGFDVGNPIGYQVAEAFVANLDAGGKRW